MNNPVDGFNINKENISLKDTPQRVKIEEFYDKKRNGSCVLIIFCENIHYIYKINIKEEGQSFRLFSPLGKHTIGKKANHLATKSTY